MPAYPAKEKLTMDFTEKVLKAYSNIEDPRLKSIVALLIKHLHACVKEMKPTDEEWEFAWDYMRRMAAITGLERNEFLLFGDIIGVSQLIETQSPASPWAMPWWGRSCGLAHLSAQEVLPPPATIRPGCAC
jgi:hypothetical protein